MSLAGYLLVAGAGLVAGISGTMTGIGSVFSYPALLAVGLPATAANVTNTVSLSIGGLAGIHGSRSDLVGQIRTVRRLSTACVLGSVAGSVLVLASPPGVFERVVPFLVAGASLLILVPRRGRDADADEYAVPGRSSVLGILAVSVYNGYFAAAGGVLVIAVLLATTTRTLPRINGLKNVLTVLSDLVAATTYAIFGPVSWVAVVPLAIGLGAGSWLGPALARRVPPHALRIVIAFAGLGLAAKLGTDAFA